MNSQKLNENTKRKCGFLGHINGIFDIGNRNDSIFFIHTTIFL